MGTKTWATAAGMAVICGVWGSTYLAIRVVVAHLPPFTMAGVRFATAGVVLYGLLRLRGVPRPDGPAWWGGLRAGTLMLVGGNGVVCFAEQWVPSGIAALVMATSSVWLVVWDRVLGGPTPTRRKLAGTAIGLTGVAALIGPGGPVGPWWGVPALLFASNCWCLGSLSLRSARMPASPAMTCALYMLTGGAALLGLGWVLGEWPRVDLAAVPATGWAALTWLIVMGSLVAGSVFTWLVRNAPLSVVSSYAFVNPVIAVVLGATLLAEPFGPREAAALGLALSGMALSRGGRPRPASGRQDATPPGPPRAGPADPAGRRQPGGVAGRQRQAG